MYNNSNTTSRPHQTLQYHHKDSFVIQVRGGRTTDRQFQVHHRNHKARGAGGRHFTAMKLFDRFRKIIMRLMLSLPSSGGSKSAKRGSGTTPRSGDGPEPPKTSCSSYYSSNSHYSEAIADCIEFFNRSSTQDGGSDGGYGYDILDGRSSDVLV